MANLFVFSPLLLLFLLVPDSILSSTPISRFQTYLQIDTSHPNPDYPSAITFLLNQTHTFLPQIKTQVLTFVPDKPLLLLKWEGRDPTLPSILLNSHTDVVPAELHKWSAHPFSAHLDPSSGRIFARGSQDMKCVGMQYLEAIRGLSETGFVPDRTVYVSFVPDEEIGGDDGVGRFVDSEGFDEMNVGFVLDEGLANEGEEYRVFYGERSPWWMVVKAVGSPGHGAKMFDGSAMENLLKSVEVIRRFRTSQFDMVKKGVKAEGEVISVNMVCLKAGTPSKDGFVMNLQPSEAEAGFDVRVPPTADVDALEKRIAEEWAPSCRNMTFEFKQKVPVNDMFGKPAFSVADSSSPWWILLKDAVKKADGRLGKPEIFPASTDARYFRNRGLPAFGFSPMSNTPILLHDHNETVELKVEMVAIHEKRLRKCLSKIKGIEKVEVEVGNQKVIVTGYVHKNKILKAVRRSGLKADFWSAQNEILLNAYASGSYGRLRINNFSFF